MANETPQERFARVNQPRIQKILDMIGTIRGSAVSNNTTADDLLAPVRAAAGPIMATMPPGVDAPLPVPQTPKQGKSHWNEAVRFAQECPLEDAAVMMQIIAGRVEQELFERKD